MRVTLVDNTVMPEQKIAKFAAICYNSPTSPESLGRRIKNLMKVKHLATLRFANATFLVEGVSRACTHQLVRHPHLSYLQESQRYVKQDSTSFVYPPSLSKWQKVLLRITNITLLRLYNLLLKLGVKKEDARYILPNGSTSSIYITGNFNAWYDFLKNRTDSHAQWEIRGVANLVLEDLNKIAPNIFKEFV